MKFIVIEIKQRHYIVSMASHSIFNSLELLPVEKIFINRVSIVMFKFSCHMLPDPIVKLC